MSHFVGAVVVPQSVTPHTNTYPTKWPDLYGADAREVVPGTELNEYLNRALAPFDENLEYEGWIPKEEIIADGRADIESYRTTTYARYLADPEKYAADVNHPEHLEYLRTEFPEKLTWTDEQIYLNAIKHEEAGDIREDGALRTRYNPESRWDWWVIGGRWEDVYRARQGETVDAARKRVRQKLADMRDPELAAELIAAEANVTLIREQLIAQREAATSLGLVTNATTGVTYETLNEAQRVANECRAAMGWAFPRSLVIPVAKLPELAPDEEAVYDADGEPELVETYEWHDKGAMGWFGMSRDDVTDEQWAESVIAKLDTMNPQDRLFYIDFHI